MAIAWHVPVILTVFGLLAIHSLLQEQRPRVTAPPWTARRIFCMAGAWMAAVRNAQAHVGQFVDHMLPEIAAQEGAAAGNDHENPVRHQGGMDALGRVSGPYFRQAALYAAYLESGGDGALEVSGPDAASCESAPAGQRVAVAWFEREYGTLMAIIERASEQETWGAVLTLSDCLVPFFSRERRWREWEHIEQLALRAAGEVQDRLHVGCSQGNLGYIYHHQGRWDEASAAYAESLMNFRSIGDSRHERQSLDNLALLKPLRSSNAELTQPG